MLMCHPISYKATIGDARLDRTNGTDRYGNRFTQYKQKGLIEEESKALQIVHQKWLSNNLESRGQRSLASLDS